MAALSAAFLLGVAVFSSVFVTVEVDHDCDGRDCPVCLEMQNCVANFQLIGSSTVPCASPLPAPSIFTVETASCVCRAPATTLQTLDVRFDE